MVGLPYTSTTSSGVLDNVLKLRGEVLDGRSFLLKLRKLSGIHAGIKDDRSTTELGARRKGSSQSFEQRNNEPNEKKPTDPILYFRLHRSRLPSIRCAICVNGLAIRNDRCGFWFPAL